MSLVASDPSGMPPPARRAPPKRKLEVLDEDQYTAALEAIIERDFFPEIPKMQNKLEWMQAVASENPTAIKRAQANIARRRAGLKTPLPSDMPPLNTPGTVQLRTPAMTPMVTGPEKEIQAPDGHSKAPSLSLDQFLAQYTGEDNAAFEELLEQTNLRVSQKKAHLYEDKNQPLLLTGPNSTDEYGTTGQQPSTLIMWKHVPKNRLYYDGSQQETVPLTEGELSALVKGPPKEINHGATRITSTAEVLEAPEPQDMAPPVGDPPAQAGGLSGYKYIACPSPVPGVDATPIMTWGEVGSTPLRLDAEDDVPLDPAAVNGPQFRVAPPSARERVGRALAQGATVGLVRQKKSHPSPSPLLKSVRTTQTPLSSAGKRLASMLHSKVNTNTRDSQLRASYTPTPKVVAAGTPNLQRHVLGTPTPKVTRGGEALMVPGGSKTRTQQPVDVEGAAPPVTLAGGSITDDLLRI